MPDAPDRPLTPGKVKRRCTVLYLVQAEQLGHVKIGFTNRISSRFASMQTGSPDKLVLLGTIKTPEPRLLEIEWHSRFAHLHSHGEWFRGEPELMTAIAAAIGPDARRIQRPMFTDKGAMVRKARLKAGRDALNMLEAERALEEWERSRG